MKLSKHKKSITAASYIKAEDEEFMTDEEIESMNNSDTNSDLNDVVDNLEDQVDELSDQLDDVEEDEPTIEIENNIENHYLAECDRCHGVFISSLMESDQEVESLSGTCPLCGKDTNQYVKWVIKKIGSEEG